MSLSLREQLLKAGLVTEQQAQRADRDQKRQQYVAPRGKKAQAAPSPQEIAARRAAAEKAAKDAELNRRKQEKIERRAKFAEIRQLVGQHQVPRVETDDNYNFQDGTRIRRISVTPQLRERLIRGELAIVRNDGRYAFVPAAIGEQVKARVERALIHLNRPAAAPDPDDPYKDHVIPDDLIW
jgi:uncharacterized protein YaiL (DUF2058 family)